MIATTLPVSTHSLPPWWRANAHASASRIAYRAASRCTCMSRSSPQTIAWMLIDLGSRIVAEQKGVELLGGKVGEREKLRPAADRVADDALLGPGVIARRAVMDAVIGARLFDRHCAVGKADHD